MLGDSMRVAGKAGTDISQGKRRMCTGLKQKSKGKKGKRARTKRTGKGVELSWPSAVVGKMGGAWC